MYIRSDHTLLPRSTPIFLVRNCAITYVFIHRVDDIINPHEVWLFLRDWWEGANHYSDVLVKTRREYCTCLWRDPGRNIPLVHSWYLLNSLPIIEIWRSKEKLGISWLLFCRARIWGALTAAIRILDRLMFNNLHHEFVIIRYTSFTSMLITISK